MDSNLPPFQWVKWLRQVSETALRTVHNRIELFAVELQEEIGWLLACLLWVAVVVFFGGLAIIFMVGTIVFLAPDGARGWVLGGFAAAFVFIAVNAIVGLKRSMRDKPPPLADTLSELK